MLNYKKVWAHLVAEKQVTSSNIVEFCIVKAIYASRGNLKKAEKLLTMYLSKAFTPITRKNRLGNGEHQYTALQKAILAVSKSHVIGAPVKSLGDYEPVYQKLVEYLSHTKVSEYSKRHYVYIFVRQDVFKEYQLVQAAHAAYVAGYQLRMCQQIDAYKDCSPHQMYFTVVGVHSQSDLKKVMVELTDQKIGFSMFREPDIGDEITALATYPIKVNKRGKLLRYKLLSFTLGELDPKIDQAA